MLTIIIISYNSASIIERCQKDLLNSNLFKIHIIDNASPNGSAEILKKRFPLINIDKLDKNIGYGRAANIGLHKSKTPYTLLLNPDLTASPENINKLLFYAQNDQSNTAIWGPASLKKDFIFDKSPQNVPSISGCAMLFDMEKIIKIGMFDEEIFLFAEDAELCERTINKGYHIKLCPNIYFDHIVGHSSDLDPKVEYMKWWHFGWSQCYLLNKNFRYNLYQTPIRKFITYKLHSLVSSTLTKRQKWRAKADGAKAFIRGIKAFDNKGIPQKSPTYKTTI